MLYWICLPCYRSYVLLNCCGFPYSTRFQFKTFVWLFGVDLRLQAQSLRLRYWQAKFLLLFLFSRVVLAPQVQVINGQIVINEESLLVSHRELNVDDIQTYRRVEETSSKLNYHTYMNRTPVERWTKSDTELFYKVEEKWPDLGILTLSLVTKYLLVCFIICLDRSWIQRELKGATCDYLLSLALICITEKTYDIF